MNRCIWYFTMVTCIVVLLAGCGSEPRGIYVSKTQFGEKWPFTVPDGRIEYINGGAVVFHYDGKIYALNGIARGFASDRGYLEIDSIWREHPDIPGAKINIGPLIDLGLKQRK